jgi:PAS domain S-box-containing protein
MPEYQGAEGEQSALLDALRASEERFRLAVDFSYDWEYWEGTDGRYVYVSPSCARITGYTAEEFLREPDLFTRIVHPDDRVAMEHHREHERRSSGTHSLHYRILHRDGQERWIGHVCQRVYGTSGAWLGWRGSNRDITGQKEAQAAMILAERLATTRQLAVSLAHEINNPLQSAIGCLDLALESLNEGKGPEQFLKVVCQELERAGAVVGQLHSLHQQINIEERRPVDVGDLLDQVMVLSEEQCQGQGVAVSLELEQDLPLLPLQTDAMQHVLVNMVLNALEAMPHGGELRIGVERSAEPGGVWIRFADTGSGLPADVRRQINEMFHRAESDSVGLDLFVSHNIVQQHQGRMEVESWEDRGTIFSLWLPT